MATRGVLCGIDLYLLQYCIACNCSQDLGDIYNRIVSEDNICSELAGSRKRGSYYNIDQ